MFLKEIAESKECPQKLNTSQQKKEVETQLNNLLERWSQEAMPIKFYKNVQQAGIEIGITDPCARAEKKKKKMEKEPKLVAQILMSNRY